MADIIRLTEDWVSVTGAVDQPLYAAIDVLAYDVLDLMIITSLDGTTPNLDMKLLSSMHTQSTGAWVELVDAFPSANTASPIKTLRVSSTFFRYLRWSVATSSSFTAARFMIEGVGRKNG